MVERLNIRPLKREWLEILLDPRLFPLDIVLLSAYELLTKLAIRIEGEPAKQLQVRIARRHAGIPLCEWGLLFQQKLMEVSLKEHRWGQKAGVREYLLAAAISYDARMANPPKDLLKESEEKLIEKLTYSVNSTATGLELVVKIGENGLSLARSKIFRAANRLTPACYLLPQRVESERIVCSVRPKKNYDVPSLKKQICNEFEIS